MRTKLILTSIVLMTTILLPKAANTEETTKTNPFGADWGKEQSTSEQSNEGATSDTRNPNKGATSGSRNPLACDYTNSTEIKALRPTSDTIDTQKSHPDFLFYLQGPPSNESQPIKIRYSIVDDETDATVIFTDFEVETSDTLIALSMPEEISGLEVGKDYILTIGVICQENRPNRDRIDIFTVKRLDDSMPMPWLDDLYQAFNSGNRASFQKLLEQKNLSSFDSKILSGQIVAIAPEDKQKELDP